MTLFQWILFSLHVLLVAATAGHALLYKRDPRAALGWIAVCILFPLVGPCLYFLFGINRVKTRARKLLGQSPFWIPEGMARSQEEEGSTPAKPVVLPEYGRIARVSEAVTRQPLVGGNRIDMFHNGEGAYPPMLEAVRDSQRFCFLSTYIFETNDTGQQFIDELARAKKRGVDVRVLIDGIGDLYALPRASSLLRKRGVRAATFIPPKAFPPTLHINLRNHRKILVADGCAAFLGGMNIGDRHLAADLDNPSRVVDVHFRLTGPVVAQVEKAFLEDWGFVTGDNTPPSNGCRDERGTAVCRTIADGPNEDPDKIALILAGAVSAARDRIRIMTPYFLPSRELIGALQAAALRGVDVQVVLPVRSNLPFVQWATANMLWELLQWGVRIFYQPPPFVHTKLFLVDDSYAQIGSANIDARSLRLNFELVVEVYDRAFSRVLASHFRDCLARAREISLEEVDGRPIPVRVRDALAWIFTPYL
ncbi:MAG: cardiolipin synthase [Deltaproteobacteria bacterium]|nr:cardiolipin synthase [Deltaproteobacteria bacterium]